MEKLEKELEYLNDKMMVLQKLVDIISAFNDDVMEKFGENSAEDLDTYRIKGLIDSELTNAKLEYSKTKKQLR